MRLFAFTLLFGMLSALALGPSLCRAGDPVQHSRLTPCPLLTGKGPAPATSIGTARGTPVRPHQAAQAASAAMARFSAYAAAIAESIAELGERAACELEAEHTRVSQATESSKRDAVGPSTDAANFAAGGAILSFLPEHDARSHLLAGLGSGWGTMPGLTYFGHPCLALPPLDASPSSATPASTLAQLLADPRHSSGQDQAWQLNAMNEGLAAAPAPAAAEPAVELAVEPPSAEEPPAPVAIEAHRKYWFEDYTFGYEYNFGYGRQEGWLGLLLQRAEEVAAVDAEPEPARVAAEPDAFELVLDGPQRYLFLRQPAEAEPAPAQVAARAPAPAFQPLDGDDFDYCWGACHPSDDDASSEQLAEASSESAEDDLRPLITSAARTLNELGATIIHLSCDLYYLAERMDRQQVSPSRYAERPEAERLGQKPGLDAKPGL